MPRINHHFRDAQKQKQQQEKEENHKRVRENNNFLPLGLMTFCRVGRGGLSATNAPTSTHFSVAATGNMVLLLASSALGLIAFGQADKQPETNIAPLETPRGPNPF